MIANLDLSRFTSGFENYFGRFSPTLRSIALFDSTGLSWQLVDFLGLFPKLDDIEIVRYRGTIGTDNPYDTRHAQIQVSLRGKLTFFDFMDQKLSEQIVNSFGGMRFVSIDLNHVARPQLFLDACAKTLQTLRVRSRSLLFDRKSLLEEYKTTPVLTEPVRATAQTIDLSRNTALRSLEIPSFFSLEGFSRAVEKLLLTITSPVFSKIIVTFCEAEMCLPRQGVAEALSKMYRVRRFRLEFRLETMERLRVANLQALETMVRTEVANCSYDFLPCPPVVSFRALTTHACFTRSLRSLTM